MNHTLALCVVIFFAGFILSLGLTARMRAFLLHRAMLDMPNIRSSHNMPTPRGGGLALLLILLPGMVIAALWNQSYAEHAGLIAAVLLLGLISWLDDRRGTSAILRLSLHLLAACIGSLAFPLDETLFHGHISFLLDRAILIVGWTWFINLYNFMDGIDGITGTETIALAIGGGLLLTATGINDPFLATLCLLLISASLGFLALNWYPARIFMGDVGSVPLGFLTGYILLTLAMKGYLIPALILPLYYLADSGITLAKRALRGEKIWQAHRLHFYQIAAAGIKRHDKVVYRILIADTGLIAAAMIAVTNPGMGLILAIALVGVLLRELYKLSKRKNGR